MIQQLSIPATVPLTNTFPVLRCIYVQSTESTIICGKNTRSSDIKGPPNVGLNKRSAPGPISIKNGTYCIKHKRNIPPAMQNAFFHQHEKKPLMPDSFVDDVGICAMILLLLRIKNITKNGR